MIFEETFTLNNGVTIPKIALGTWMIEDKDVIQVVRDALDVGYRHIDTAQAYENERGVGEAIRTSSVGRENVFVTTKLAAEIKSYQEAVDAIENSLKRLDTHYIDLMLIHSPQPWDDFHGDEHYFEGNREAWRAMEEAYKADKIRAIGVSNFEQEDIDNLMESETPPMVNQLLAHISNTPFELINYCQQRDILVEAYSPIGHGAILENERIKKIAENYDVSVAQLSIRYTLQLGMLPLPKTTNPDHMKSNADVDFTISDEDMEALKALDRIEDYGDDRDMPVFGLDDVLALD